MTLSQAPRTLESRDSVPTPEVPPSPSSSLVIIAFPDSGHDFTAGPSVFLAVYCCSCAISRRTSLDRRDVWLRLSSTNFWCRLRNPRPLLPSCLPPPSRECVGTGQLSHWKHINVLEVPPLTCPFFSSLVTSTATQHAHEVFQVRLDCSLESVLPENVECNFSETHRTRSLPTSALFPP